MTTHLQTVLITDQSESNITMTPYGSKHPSRPVSTCVINNGHANAFLDPTGGTRQGCPIPTNVFKLPIQ